MMAEREAAAAGRRLVTPVFVLVTLATFAYFVSIGALIPTLPRFVEGPLSGTRIAVGLAVGSFSITAVLLRPLVGQLGDARGRRVLMLAGSALVGLSVLGLLAVTSLGPLIALRLVTGAGEAFFYVGAATVINDLAPDHRRGEALSFFSLALYSGIALGPVLGEWVLEAEGYDPVWVLASVSALVATALAVAVPDTRPEGAGGGHHRRAVHPAGLMPGTVLATSVWGLAGFNTFVPLYALQLGLSGSRFVFVLYSAIVLSFRSLGARIPDRLGIRRTAGSALAASGAGLALIAVWGSAAGLFAGAALFAVGQALTFPALMSLAVSSARPQERGAVVGTFTAFFDLAFGLGAVSLGLIASILGYRGTFATAAVIAAIGMLLLLAYTGEAAVRRRARTIEEQQEPVAR